MLLAPAWLEYLGLAAALLLLVAFRLHAFAVPLETDECNYALIGARLLAGERLYLDVWDHQPFGVFALFAAIIYFLGDSPEVIRWMATGFSAANLLLIFAIVRSAAGRLPALAAALLFAVVNADPGTAGDSCNREIYMTTAALAAWWLVLRTWRARDSAQRAPTDALGSLCLGGLALAVGSSLKTILAVHWVVLAAWVALTGRPTGGGRRSPPVPYRLLAFGAGPLLLWLAAFAYFAATQRGGAFLDAVFGFNLSYSAGADSFSWRFVDFFRPGRQKQPFVFDSALPLWVGGGAATVYLLWCALRRRDRIAGAVAGLVVAAYLATCLPAQFWPHYYYLMLPPLVVAVGVAVGRLGECGEASVARHPRPYGGDPAPPTTRWHRRGLTVALLMMALVLGASVVTEYRHYLGQPPFGVTIRRYNGRDFWGRAQGENVARVTQPGDEIFVYGNEAEIYYYARRRCASRYTMVTGLRSGYRGHAERRAVMLEEIARRRPRLILVVLGEEAFAEWSSFLLTRYDAVGYDFRDRPPHDPILMVLCDRERPVETIEWNWDRAAVGGWSLGERP
ncbi:MAG: hypothetical protein HY763_15995 [Planctomycetes bacterium]|nr:hypothetical protein [Planctomycetota bacterium]